MSETPSLKRDSTMAVTAQEGEAFLQSQGMEVTEDAAKTRAQKEKLEEIENEAQPKLPRTGTMAATAEEGENLLDGCGDLERTRAQTAVVKETKEESKTEVAEESETTSPSKPAVVRDNTMVTTAQEGAALLEGHKMKKTRAQTKEAGAGPTTPTKEAEAGPTTPTKEAGAGPTTPTKVKRSTTIAQTAEASSHILGSEERGRTRSQTRRMSEREQSEEEGAASKPSVKRTSTMARTAKEGEEFLERQAKQAKLDENGDKASADVTEAEA